MPSVKDTELFKLIKNGEIGEVYFFFGDENYFIKKAVNQIIDRTVEPSAAGFNLTRVDGEKLDLNELYEQLDSLPVMAEKKCVVLKNLDFEKLTKDKADELIEMISDPNPSIVFIIAQLAVAVDTKKSAKYKKLIAAVEKVGVVCEFAQKDASVLKRALCERAAAENIVLDTQTAGELIECVGLSYETLINEEDKLIALAKGKPEYNREITRTDIEDCCIPSIAASAFDLAKNILYGSFDKAYNKLDDLFFLRQEAVAILSALSMAFSDLYRAKCAMAANVSAESMTADFNYPKSRSFAVKNAMRDARGFSIGHIRRCIDAIYRADIQLKSAKLDDRLILERMLGQMMQSAYEDKR